MTPLTHLVGVRRLLEAGLTSELPNGLDGAHVLELGAGLGLSAMVAAARGARSFAATNQIHQTDDLSEALERSEY